MSYFVYLITNRVNQKVYVGKTNNPKARWKGHKSSGSGKWTSCIGKAIRKYGVDNFTFSILETYPTEEAAYQGEVDWIAAYRSNQPDFGYNLESGGSGGKVASDSTRLKQSILRIGKPRPPEVIAKLHSPEARRKVAEANRGKPRSESTKQRISQAHLGRSKSPDSVERSASKHRGKPLTQEHKARLSSILKRRVLTPEHRSKLSNNARKLGASRRGVPLTQEHKSKISSSLKSTSHPRTKPLTEEHKLKLSLALKGRQLSPEHLSKISEANRANGLRRRGVPLSQERIANMSAAQRGRPKSPEHIARVVAAKKAAKEARLKLVVAKLV